MNDGNGNVAGNPLNEKSGSAPRLRSKFFPGYDLFNTNRFGEISPFFVMEGLAGDHVSLNSSQKVDSYTLKAPLMQDIKLVKELYLVPRQALLPLNWDKFFTNPVIGDDVPDDCGTGVKSFWQKVFVFYSAWLSSLRLRYNSLDNTDPLYSEDLRKLFFDCWRWLIVGEYFYSNGNLLSSLRIHGSKFLTFDGALFVDSPYEPHSFDRLFDNFASSLSLLFAGSGFAVTWQANTCIVLPDNTANPLAYGNKLSFREFFDIMRDDPYAIVSAPNDDPAIDASYENFLSGFQQFGMVSYHTVDDDLDLARPLSYQIVCSHFYSNDHVDYIYSADLYRQYVHSFYRLFTNYERVFTWNGLNLNYDYLSASYFNYFIAPANILLSDTTLRAGVRYLCAIFSYRHSLRFVDYFVGSRTRPYAIGNTDVSVNANLVSVVDTVRNIQKQRFINAVNRVGRKIGDYIKLLRGVDMDVDYHNPLYLGSTSDLIFGDRSEYTGNVSDSEQNNVSSVLKSSGGRYTFDWDCDRECVIIGVQYYDIHRVYSESIDRQCFHMNRFDMFNDFMQFIGDQTVYKSELSVGGEAPFGYQTRHSEYKQSFDVCAGGFVEYLPAWIFKAERGFRRYEQNISPMFIRSFASEFDQFYVSLTGYSLGSYWHFIVASNNIVDSSRPMAQTPDLLQ